MFTLQKGSTYLAQESLLQLDKSPMKKALLARTDVFFIDEFGMIDTNLFHCLDLILRDIMHSDIPWGGKLVIATGDPLQLPPVEGRPIWLSTHMVSTFNIVQLRHYVRSAHDQDLRNILELLRCPEVKEENAGRLCEIVCRRCRFVPSFSDAPRNAMRVVSTRNAEREVACAFIGDVRRDGNIVKDLMATDEVEATTGSWKLAQSHISVSLDRKLLENHHLQLFEGALVRMTHNQNHAPLYSQGQMAFVQSVPDEQLPYRDQKLKLALVPPGNLPDITNIHQWDVVSLVLAIVSLYFLLIHFIPLSDSCRSPNSSTSVGWSKHAKGSTHPVSSHPPSRKHHPPNHWANMHIHCHQD